MQIENIFRSQNKCGSLDRIYLSKVTQHWGKRRKYCLPLFSFSTVLPKVVIFQAVKSQDCLVKEKETSTDVQLSMNNNEDFVMFLICYSFTFVFFIFVQLYYTNYNLSQ